MNRVYCPWCRVYVHRNCVWKHNKSDKIINNRRYEQTDSFDNVVEKPEWFFREKRFRSFVKPFQSKLRLRDQ